ncbi:hypothetical protein BWK63_13805, partial [Flavobacterium covae]
AKKLDPNKKEIVLLSCNDLTSAQALAQATGKKVYTTDGAITIFENGIKRADNTKWYEVSSDGTAIELSSPPVKECSTCTGEGVVMGVAGLGESDKLLDLFFKSKLGSWTRKVIQNKKWVDFIDESGVPSASEIDQLEALGEKLQKRMIGLEKSPNNNTPFPGIDGIIDGGNPLSLKTAVPGKEGIRLREMVNKANELNNGNVAGHSEWAGSLNNKIDGMITTSQSTKSYVKQRWEAVLSDQSVNSSIINNLYIEASDGWLKWSSKTNSWIEL